MRLAAMVDLVLEQMQQQPVEPFVLDARARCTLTIRSSPS